MMPMLPVLLPIVLSIASLATGVQQDPAGPPASQVAASQPSQPSPEVLQLVRQLDDPFYERREEAQQKLLNALSRQPSLEAWLAQAAQSEPSPEVRTRLGSVKAKLAENRLLGASLVSLNMSEVHPRELINELGRQSGVRFEYWPQDPWEMGGAAGGKVSLKLDSVPFWDALRRVSETTSIYPVEHQPAAPGSIVLSQHGEQFATFPTRHHGAFAVQLRRIYRRQDAQVELGVERGGRIAGNSQSNSSLSIEVRLLVEPKIRLTGSMNQPVLEQAVDEGGKNLLPPADNRRTVGRMWSNSASPWAIQSNFALDARAAAQSERIAHLRGQLEVEVALELVVLELKLADFADVRRLRPDEKVPISKRHTVGNYQIEFTSLRRAQDDAIYIDFTITPQPGTPDQLQEEWARMQALSSALRMEDASGRVWSATGGGTSWDGSSAQISRGFHRGGQNAGPAVRLVWEIPARIMPLSIPFEFTDIPLPAWD